jgi:hypothetical protein
VELLQVGNLKALSKASAKKMVEPEAIQLLGVAETRDIMNDFNPVVSG